MPSLPRRDEEALREAEICARVIRAWHVTIGAELAPARMRDSSGALRRDNLTTYRETIARFADADLSRPANQAELARIQLSGVFEWFYGEEIPPGLWDDYHDELRSRPPARLSDAARRILDLQASAFRLKDHPQHQAEESSPSPRSRDDRTRIRFSTPKAFLEAGRRYYEAYTSEETIDIGGASLLLSCSVERSPLLVGGDVVLLPGPEALGLAIPTPEGDHLLGRVRAGEVSIEQVEGD
jgi:hypothetical protein